MENMEFEIIKAGTRVHMKEEPERTGTVVMQAETTGKCLIKMDKYAPDLSTAGGLLREPHGIWLKPDMFEVEEAPVEEYVPDMRKNWSLYMACIDGKISYAWRAESGSFMNGWVRKENMTPVEALREFADGLDMEEGYRELCGEAARTEEEPEKEPDELRKAAGKLGELIGILGALKDLAEEE